MKRNKHILIVVLSIVLTFIFNNFFITSMIKGVYVSNNTEPMVDGPRFGDTLILLDNNKFLSDTWGEGIYKLEHTFKGTRLDLSYNYEFGKAGYNSYFYRSYFYGKPRIVVFRDLNFYFKKKLNNRC